MYKFENETGTKEQIMLSNFKFKNFFTFKKSGLIKKEIKTKEQYWDFLLKSGKIVAK